MAPRRWQRRRVPGRAAVAPPGQLISRRRAAAPPPPRQQAWGVSMLFFVYYARSNRCDRSRGRAPQTSRVAAVGPCSPICGHSRTQAKMAVLQQAPAAQISMCSLVRPKRAKTPGMLVCYNR